VDPAGQRNAGAASNQYQILGHLATGGMAELYLARAVGIAGFERYVVLKRIMAEHARNHRFVTMFLDEARLAAQLHHPNIAQVYDIGRVSDSYFFTMEYVHGENVRDLLQRVAALKRQIPFEVSLTVIAGAAAGLHYAHDKRGINRQPLGIVHRDVSPSNLMVAYEGAVKLVDFGIAKASHRMTETRSGAVKGKVAYMSPEQCTGHPLDRRATSSRSGSCCTRCRR
jgi:eukaryotic-like serine/threonine-protein kinase